MDSTNPLRSFNCLVRVGKTWWDFDLLPKFTSVCKLSDAWWRGVQPSLAPKPTHTGRANIWAPYYLTRRYRIELENWEKELKVSREWMIRFSAIYFSVSRLNQFNLLTSSNTSHSFALGFKVAYDFSTRIWQKKKSEIFDSKSCTNFTFLRPIGWIAVNGTNFFEILTSIPNFPSVQIHARATALIRIWI